MSLPDDCGECPVCGQPQFGFMSNSVCKDCRPPRDDKGRFIKRDTEERKPLTSDETTEVAA